jgi:hypothetical protein
MEALSPILIGAAVAALVAVGARRFLRARARRDPEGGALLAARRRAAEVTFLVVGVLLMVLSVVVGLRLLHVEEPPRGELFPAGVGIATDVAAKPGRGFVSGLSAAFHSCDEPVDVTVVLAPTAEYFEDHRARLRTPSHVTIALPGTSEIHDLTVAHGQNYNDALIPQMAGPEQVAEALPGAAPIEHLAVTSVRRTVRSWWLRLTPIVVRFRADWLLRRGLGTCYLKLPPLVGDKTILAAQDGRGRAFRTLDELLETRPFLTTTYVYSDGETLFALDRPSLTVNQGIAVVSVGNDEVVRSEPESDSIAAGLPAISCSKPTPTKGGAGDLDAHLITTSSADAYAIRAGSFRAYARSHDCAALVTLAEAGAGRLRDLILLLVGASFSLGAALVLEVLLDLHRRTMAGAGPGDADDGSTLP